MKRMVAVISVIVVTSLLLSVASVLAQGNGPQGSKDLIGTTFTYQGQLKNANGPVNGKCDLQFNLWNDPLIGMQLGPMVSELNHDIVNGLFTVQLDFGSNAFNGDARWLSIDVRCPAGSGDFTKLSPRQLLTSAPQANVANRLTWGASWSGNGSGIGLSLQGGAGGLSANGTDYGVLGQTNAYTNSRGVMGIANSTSGFADGVYGETQSKDGSGVVGFNANTAGGVGVFGQSLSTQGYGMWGTGLITGTVGEATSTSGTTFGVYGISKSTNGGYGVYGRASSAQGSGVYGYNATGRGVRGESSNNDGVAGFSFSGSGVYGQSQSGTGLYGSSPAGTGVHGDGAQYGVQGDTSSNSGYGVYGRAPLTGTVGIATSNASLAIGVYGQGPNGVEGYSATPQGNGVYGVANTGNNAYGVYGASSSGYAGVFNGKVQISTNLFVGGAVTVTGNFSAGGTKAFKIDNPLNPAGQYLYHYAIEAPQVQNMYNGTITLDAKGEAVVTLPAYFSAVNGGDFRYTLTAIGAPMPNLYLAQEVTGNTFKIAGGVAGKKVSWTVFAQRNDPWLRDHPATDVVDKPASEVGTYVYPQGYGQPETKGANYMPLKPMGGQ